MDVVWHHDERVQPYLRSLALSKDRLGHRGSHLVPLESENEVQYGRGQKDAIAAHASINPVSLPGHAGILALSLRTELARGRVGGEDRPEATKSEIRISIVLYRRTGRS